MSGGVETNALSLRWTFGFNSTIPNCASSLVTPDRNAIFYVAAHTGVILDTSTEKQTLLQGHCHEISASCVSSDKRYIVTADRGPDSMIVVWDSYTAIPLRTIINPFPNGTCAIDISKDGRYIAALSHNHPAQEFAVYEWQVSDAPTVHAVVDASAHGSHPTSVPLPSQMENTEFLHCIRFNPTDPQDIITNGSSQVIFWIWGGSTLVPVIPAKGVRASMRKVGVLTQSVFLPHTTKATTSTSRGMILIWDYPHKASAAADTPQAGSALDGDLLSTSKYQLYDPQAQTQPSASTSASAAAPIPAITGRDCIKALSLCKAPINVLTVVNSAYLVCACGDGAVRFYDLQFRITAWFEHMHQGALISASFALEPEYATFPLNSSPDLDFSVPELTVATDHGRIVRIRPQLLDTVNNNTKNKGVALVRGFAGSVDALDAHPTLPVFATGTSEGTLQLWDLDDREPLASRTFTSATGTSTGPSGSNSGSADTNTSSASTDPSADEDAPQGTPCPITAVKFAPGGKFLCVGFADGRVELTTSLATALSIPMTQAQGQGQGQGVSELDSGVIDPLQCFQSFHIHNSKVTHIAFSSNQQYMAVSDSSHHVSLFKYTHAEEHPEKPLEWVYIASHIAHFDAIVALAFEPGHIDLSRTPAKIKQQHQQDTVKLQRFFAKCPPRHLKLFQDVQGQASATITHNPLLAAFASASNSASNISLATKVALLAAAVAAPRLPLKAPAYRSPHPRLLSTGRDGRVVEYDLARSSIKQGLRVAHVTVAEREGRLTAACVYSGAVAPAREFVAAYTAQSYQQLALSSVRDGAAADARAGDGRGTGAGAGILSVGPNVGATYPPLPLLLRADPDSLQVQAETMVLASDLGKLTLWHSQQPVPLPAAHAPNADDQRTATPACGSSSDPAFWWRAICSAAPASHDPAQHPAGTNTRAYYHPIDPDHAPAPAPAQPSSATACLISTELVASAPSLVPVPPPPSLAQPLVARKTVAAPEHAAPITRLAPLPLRIERAGVSEYLAYACADQLIGLAKLPLTGNPNDSTAVVAHPGAVAQMVCTADGRYVLTAGGPDRTVHVWAVNASCLDVTAAQYNAAAIHAAKQYRYPVSLTTPHPRRVPVSGADDPSGDPSREPSDEPSGDPSGDPSGGLTARVVHSNGLPLADAPALTAVALTVLLGAGPPSLRADLLDHFCHAQLRWQGLYTTHARVMTGLIPPTECVNLFRALGCFLSETDARRLHHQVTWEQYAAQGCTQDAPPGPRVPAANEQCVSLAGALQLLLGFRALDHADTHAHTDVAAALRAVQAHYGDAAEGRADDDVGREVLIRALAEHGHRTAPQELNVSLRALLGTHTHTRKHADAPAAAPRARYTSHNLFGARARKHVYAAPRETDGEAATSATDYLQLLPARVDAATLCGDVLGLGQAAALLADEERSNRGK